VLYVETKSGKHEFIQLPEIFMSQRICAFFAFNSGFSSFQVPCPNRKYYVKGKKQTLEYSTLLGPYPMYLVDMKDSHTLGNLSRPIDAQYELGRIYDIQVIHLGTLW
jgi:hypothetical protein